MDCPICFEIVNPVINCVTTECGHSFHANCLMKNVAHNGFGCPCCRATMAETNKEDPDDDSDSDDGDDSDDSGSSDSDSDLDDCYDDEYTLRGLRLFMNRIEGEANDPADLGYEEDVSPPTIDYMIEKLGQKEGLMENLVKALLVHHDEYVDNCTIGMAAHDMWATFNSIIFEYKAAETTISS